jgi:hypothetical protein
MSVSVGRRGAWATFGRQGTRTTVGLPGTGLSYTSFPRNRGQQSPIGVGGALVLTVALLLASLLLVDLFIRT